MMDLKNNETLEFLERFFLEEGEIRILKEETIGEDERKHYVVSFNYKDRIALGNILIYKKKEGIYEVRSLYSEFLKNLKKEFLVYLKKKDLNKLNNLVFYYQKRVRENPIPLTLTKMEVKGVGIPLFKTFHIVINNKTTKIMVFNMNLDYFSTNFKKNKYYNEVEIVSNHVVKKIIRNGKYNNIIDLVEEFDKNPYYFISHKLKYFRKKYINTTNLLFFKNYQLLRKDNKKLISWELPDYFKKEFFEFLSTKYFSKKP